MCLFELFDSLELDFTRDIVVWGIDDDKQDWDELYEGPLYEIPLWVLVQTFIAMFISEEDPEVLHFSVEFDFPDDEE